MGPQLMWSLIMPSLIPQRSRPHCENSLAIGGAEPNLNEVNLDVENLFVADSEPSEPILDNWDVDIIVDDTTQTLDDVGVPEFDNLSEVGFINNEDVLDSLDGIQLCVDLNAERKEVKNSEKREWKQKSIEQILDIPKTKKKGGKRSKVVLFRFAVAAAALPISFERVSRTHLDEAQAIWEVNKIMGLSYMGDEKDVIRRIVIMEVEDEERVKGHASHPLIGS
ncbi:hypothetical protein RHMOL_Rhmol12G0088300 [Rhododendron molle]|uniref:Uncharacterized protein n=1 Tax=Rhododendron molle TaxID=49168 RepID=A0ACC0LFV2_RHOML|nr:hypothetical protein RHMOL_Rhmol12G0088300 [Rhododendron molle]